MGEPKEGWRRGDLVAWRWPSDLPKVWRVLKRDDDETGPCYMVEHGRMYTWARADDLEDAPPGSESPPEFRTEFFSWVTGPT